MIRRGPDRTACAPLWVVLVLVVGLLTPALAPLVHRHDHAAARAVDGEAGRGVGAALVEPGEHGHAHATGHPHHGVGASHRSHDHGPAHDEQHRGRVGPSEGEDHRHEHGDHDRSCELCRLIAQAGMMERPLPGAPLAVAVGAADVVAAEPERVGWMPRPRAALPRGPPMGV